jgi:hypothetical protein
MCDMKQTCSTRLKDADPDYTDKLPIRLEVSPGGISLYAEGFGDHGSAENHGSPVYVELHRGILRLVVWADINKEGPTHVIPLNGAREDRRQPHDEE